jgi:hypothetical protein
MPRKVLLSELGVFTILETDMEDEWPAGDPVARDKETLCTYVERRNQSGDITYQAHQ